MPSLIPGRRSPCRSFYDLPRARGPLPRAAPPAINVCRRDPRAFARQFRTGGIPSSPCFCDFPETATSQNCSTRISCAPRTCRCRNGSSAAPKIDVPFEKVWTSGPVSHVSSCPALWPGIPRLSGRQQERTWIGPGHLAPKGRAFAPFCPAHGRGMIFQPQNS